MKTIDGKTYALLPSEFQKQTCEYSTLNVLDKIGYYDRIASLISEISNKMQCRSVIFGSITHGGYIPINCHVHTNFLFDCDITQQSNIVANIENNKQYIFISDLSIINEAFVRKSVLFTETYDSKYDEFVLAYTPIIISDKSFIEGYYTLELLNTTSPTFVLVPNHMYSVFSTIFACYLNNGGLNYDNLINLCIMVKNGGDDFVSMLEANLPFIDRWTILDTGSTDNTVENVRRIMAGKPGMLYQEPFINFGVSRNRCLELAGTQCTYNIMLDDTYHLKGNIRAFLQQVRGDQFADSFSLYITQPDIAYASNRIFKSKRGLKYKYAIHEVIQEENNVNVIVPNETAFIHDVQSEKLAIRTSARKQQDLVMLQEEINANPNDPRPYYYMAQTYNGMEQFEDAYNWFLRRINHPVSGFEQEKHEACLEAGRVAQFVLKRPAEEYLKLYELACQVDAERPDALYFLGSHYLSVSDTKRAFDYLSKGFKLGYPEHRQYCLKPSITYTHIPALLTNICYDLRDFILGGIASDLYLKHNKVSDNPNHETIVSWNKIFLLLNHSSKVKSEVVSYSRKGLPICCFIAPCGMNNWTGSDIITCGLGGSESMIVELATQLHLLGRFQVMVFCNCTQEEVYKNVRYIPLTHVFHVLHSNYIHTCIISRYSEYLPLMINSTTENIYLLAQDIAFSGNVITLARKLKGIICLTPWHAKEIERIYPVFNPLMKIVGHGIECSKLTPSTKIPYKFIYSSMANRGLLELLRMWPKIIQWQPSSTLHIYSSIDSQYMKNTFGEMMKQIDELIQTSVGVIYHGWVDKHALYESWKTADVWFYPTNFKETFCVTALEAAASKTLVITTNLAGLQYTVGDRGILLDSLDNAVDIVINTMENTALKESLIEKNYQWALTNTWETQTTNLENILLTNKVEYLDTYNWTDNNETRALFTETMRQHLHSGARILELGADTGISLIYMLFTINNSTGVAIDTWNRIPYLRMSFDSNLIHTEMAERITAISASATDGLLELCKKDDSFNLIYFNTKKGDMMDFYSELVIAWKLLQNEGLMIIGSLEGPRLEAVSHFIRVYYESSTIWKKHSHICIKKIVSNK